jgi:hypothetical protein
MSPPWNARRMRRCTSHDVSSCWSASSEPSARAMSHHSDRLPVRGRHRTAAPRTGHHLRRRWGRPGPGQAGSCRRRTSSCAPKIYRRALGRSPSPCVLAVRLERVDELNMESPLARTCMTASLDAGATFGLSIGPHTPIIFSRLWSSRCACLFFLLIF